MLSTTSIENARPKILMHALLRAPLVLKSEAYESGSISEHASPSSNRSKGKAKMSKNAVLASPCQGPGAFEKGIRTGSTRHEMRFELRKDQVLSSKDNNKSQMPSELLLQSESSSLSSFVPTSEEESTLVCWPTSIKGVSIIRGRPLQKSSVGECTTSIDCDIRESNDCLASSSCSSNISSSSSSSSSSSFTGSRPNGGDADDIDIKIGPWAKENDTSWAVDTIDGIMFESRSIASMGCELAENRDIGSRKTNTEDKDDVGETHIGVSDESSSPSLGSSAKLPKDDGMSRNPCITMQNVNEHSAALFQHISSQNENSSSSFSSSLSTIERQPSSLLNAVEEQGDVEIEASKAPMEVGTNSRGQQGTVGAKEEQEGMMAQKETNNDAIFCTVYAQLASVEKRLKSFTDTDYLPSQYTATMALSGIGFARKRRRTTEQLQDHATVGPPGADMRVERDMSSSLSMSAGSVPYGANLRQTFGSITIQGNEMYGQQHRQQLWIDSFEGSKTPKVRKKKKRKNKVKLKNRHFKDSREQKISKMPNIPALMPIDVSSLYAGRAPETLSMATRATFDWMIKELHTSMPGAAAALVNRMEAHAKGIRAQQTSLAQRQLRQLNRNNSSNNSTYNGSNSVYFPTFHPEVAEKDFFDGLQALFAPLPRLRIALLHVLQRVHRLDFTDQDAQDISESSLDDRSLHVKCGGTGYDGGSLHTPGPKIDTMKNGDAPNDSNDKHEDDAAINFPGITELGMENSRMMIEQYELQTEIGGDKQHSEADGLVGGVYGVSTVCPARVLVELVTLVGLGGPGNNTPTAAAAADAVLPRLPTLEDNDSVNNETILKPVDEARTTVGGNVNSALRGSMENRSSNPGINENSNGSSGDSSAGQSSTGVVASVVAAHTGGGAPAVRGIASTASTTTLTASSQSNSPPLVPIQGQRLESADVNNRQMRQRGDESIFWFEDPKEPSKLGVASFITPYGATGKSAAAYLSREHEINTSTACKEQQIPRDLHATAKTVKRALSFLGRRDAREKARKSSSSSLAAASTAQYFSNCTHFASLSSSASSSTLQLKSLLADASVTLNFLDGHEMLDAGAALVADLVKLFFVRGGCDEVTQQDQRFQTSENSKQYEADTVTVEDTNIDEHMNDGIDDEETALLVLDDLVSQLPAPLPSPEDGVFEMRRRTAEGWLRSYQRSVEWRRERDERDLKRKRSREQYRKRREREAQEREAQSKQSQYKLGPSFAVNKSQQQESKKKKKLNPAIISGTRWETQTGMPSSFIEHDRKRYLGDNAPKGAVGGLATILASGGTPRLNLNLDPASLASSLEWSRALKDTADGPSKDPQSGALLQSDTKAVGDETANGVGRIGSTCTAIPISSPSSLNSASSITSNTVLNTTASGSITLSALNPQRKVEKRHSVQAATRIISSNSSQQLLLPKLAPSAPQQQSKTPSELLRLQQARLAPKRSATSSKNEADVTREDTAFYPMPPPPLNDTIASLRKITKTNGQADLVNKHTPSSIAKNANSLNAHTTPTIGVSNKISGTNTTATASTSTSSASTTSNFNGATGVGMLHDAAIASALAKAEADAARTRVGTEQMEEQRRLLAVQQQLDYRRLLAQQQAEIEVAKEQQQRLVRAAAQRASNNEEKAASLSGSSSSKVAWSWTTGHYYRDPQFE